jgi:hypothetical protein
MGIFRCSKKSIKQHENAQFEMLHVPTDNVDNVSEDRLSLGQILKFPYHLLVKNSVD